MADAEFTLPEDTSLMFVHITGADRPGGTVRLWVEAFGPGQGWTSARYLGGVDAAGPHASINVRVPQPAASEPCRAAAKDHFGRAMEALKHAQATTGAHLLMGFLETALNELSAARTFYWDLLSAEERAAAVRHLDACGIPSLLRGDDDLRLEA